MRYCSTKQSISSGGVEFPQSAGESVALPNACSDTITSLAVSADGAFLAYGSADGTVTVYDMEDGKMLKRFPIKKGRAMALQFAKDRARLLVGQTIFKGDSAAKKDGNVVRVYDVSSAEPVADIARHDGGIAAIELSPAGDQLLTTGFDNAARIWDLQTGTEVRSIPLASRGLGVSWAGDGSRIAITSFGSNDSMLQVFDPKSGRELMSVSAPWDCSALRFSADGNVFAGGRMINGNTGATLWTCEPPPVFAAVMDIKNQLVVVCHGWDTKLGVVSYDVFSGQVVSHWANPPISGRAITLTPDRRFIVTGDVNGEVRVWRRE